MNSIRPYQPDDWPAVWSILEPVFRAGDTYAVPQEIRERDAKHLWVEGPLETFVILDGEGKPGGTYYIKPNQPGPGASVCNCGYVVSEQSRGNGFAEAMCLHSLQWAKENGFTGMQFNLVVATNTVAIKLWKKLGFQVVGTLPKAFRHPVQGPVDAHVMFKTLLAT